MISKRKKSLSFVLLGITLFIFTFTLTKPNLERTRIYEQTSDKSSSYRTITDARKATTKRGKTQNLMKKLQHPLQKSTESEENKAELSNLKENQKVLSIQELPQVSPQATIDLKRQFPSAIILGVKKAGTRALLDALEMHPKVIAAPNEVYFFNGFHSRGLEWYRDQMPLSSPEQITIEKSPTYFTSVETTQVVNRMFVFSRSTAHILKLIVVVRDPTTRCLSEYTDLIARSTKEEIPEVKDRFERFVLNSDGSVNANASLVKTGLYIKHLNEWLKHFPKEELLFVSGEQLVKNPYQEIKTVESFLGLDAFFSERNFRFDKEKGFPCFVPGGKSESFCLPPNKGRRHVQVQKRTLEKLREFYRPYNRQFYKAVKRNFFWL